MTPEDAQHINEQRALSHIGEFCPNGCNGKLAQVVAVGCDLYTRGGGGTMTIEFECTTGHRRIYCVEPMETATVSGGASVGGYTSGTAGWQAALLGASV